MATVTLAAFSATGSSVWGWTSDILEAQGQDGRLCSAARCPYSITSEARNAAWRKKQNTGITKLFSS